MESILTEIKQLLGIDETYTHFDTNVIVHINTALMTLRQLGIGPEKPFRISDSSAKWSDLLTDRDDLEGVKDFVYLKVKLVFDPPQMGYLVQAIKDEIKELGWRLTEGAEHEGE